MDVVYARLGVFRRVWVSRAIKHTGPALGDVGGFLLFFFFFIRLCIGIYPSLGVMVWVLWMNVCVYPVFPLFMMHVFEMYAVRG